MTEGLQKIPKGINSECQLVLKGIKKISSRKDRREPEENQKRTSGVQTRVQTGCCSRYSTEFPPRDGLVLVSVYVHLNQRNT